MYDFLKGVRVLDLTAVVLGPIATQYLGDFGADVIKVEPPSGDILRHIRPARSNGMGAGYLNFNRNKRSLCVDLKKDEGRARFDALLKDADVLVHNMRPSAAKRLGLDPDEIRKTYPALVYCVAAGYGSCGPNAEYPAYDDIIQAASGVADLNKNQNGEPRFLPTVLCDKVGGMHLAMAMLAGVAHQAKTGQGCFIEAPMFEGLVSFLMLENLAGETYCPPLGKVGYERLQSPNRKPFPTKDGFIGVLPYNAKHWANFLKFTGHTDLAEADWVQNSASRSDRIGELYAVVAEVMPTRTTAEWLDILRKLDVPCTHVNSLDDLLSDPHLNQVGLFQDVQHPTEGEIRSIRSPFWVEGVEECTDAPAPNLSPIDEVISWRERA